MSFRKKFALHSAARNALDARVARMALSAFVALGFACLAGCGSAPREAALAAEPVYTGAPVVLRAAPGASALPATLNPQACALDYVNARRAEVGLPPIVADEKVAAAASDHARYLSLNRSGSHDQIAGHPGFTGVDVITRVRLHTPAYGASEVLAVFGGPHEADSPIEDIFASPYHRGAIFFDWARAGEASVVGDSAITVMDFADIAPALRDTELVAYPYEGQQDAPPSWIDNEQPDPMGLDGRYRGQTLGYPVTLSGGPSAHLELKTVDLRDAGGTKVACRIAALTPADAGRNTAVCTPYAPLRADTRYTIRVTGKLTQRTVVAPFDLRWSFRTRRLADGKTSVMARSGN